MNYNIGDMIEVYNAKEIPKLPNGMKFFYCLGGSKNFQCFVDTPTMSMSEFLIKYRKRIDSCFEPVYESLDFIIMQDAKKAIPGFYIISPKKHYKKIVEMDINMYTKAMQLASKIKQFLKVSFNANKVYIYHEEHHKKPTSVHFWVLPIYNDITSKYHLSPTINNFDIWKYLDVLEFSDVKDKIYSTNQKMRNYLNQKDLI